MVFPDDELGRHDAALMSRETAGVRTCSQFVKDRSPMRNKWSEGLRIVCRNREALGDRSHNWCMRCMAGFPMWYGDDSDHQRTII